MSEDIRSFEMSILNLIQRYIQRQQVTLEAFKALRPAIVEAEHIHGDEEKLINILNRYIDEPWKGRWHEWTYYFQGAGCRLINSKTSEIIEWEVPDVNTFDRYWFVNWLEWLWMFHPNDNDLVMLKDFFSHRPNRYDLYGIIFPMLRVLAVEGHITNNANKKNMYTVARSQEPTNIA